MNRMEERHWTAGKTESYACAGVALAIVLVLIQIKLEDSWRIASFACAAISIPMWIGMGYACSVREMWSISHKVHQSFTKYFGMMAILFPIAALLLFASFCCLLASFHSLIAAIFFVVSASVFFVLMKQELEIQRVFVKPDR